ncbi:MAG TPA: branched-chain amino acid ABC transporter permease [Thermoplasmata archaeon]|nr:branched-chain amino acid ABC transporter permease [Thermoplasmata archaeon]
MRRLSADPGIILELVWWILVFGIAALGLNIVLGQGGMFHLGTVGFMVIGGTCSMIVTSNQWRLVYDWGPLSTFFFGALLGIFVSVLLAFGIGWPTLRLRGDYFAIATLGFEEIVRITLNANPFESINPDAKTKLVLLPSVDVFGLPLISGTAGELIFVAVLFAVVFVISLRIVYSPFGRLLRASRDDELGTMSLGKDVFMLRMKAFMLSSVFGSLAGSLYVHHFRTFAPDQFSLMLTIVILLTVILGGAGSSMGTLLGVIVIKLLIESPRWLVGFAIEQYWITSEQAAGIDIGGWNLMIFAILIILTMLLYPYGFLGEGGKLYFLAERMRVAFFVSLRGLLRLSRAAPPPVAPQPPPPGNPPAAPPEEAAPPPLPPPDDEGGRS